MNAAEHRRQAERLADIARQHPGASDAHVIATTALTYATLAASTPEGPGAELAALRARVTAIHFEVDGSLTSEGSCIEDGQDYPCATLRALNTEGGTPR